MRPWERQRVPLNKKILIALYIVPISGLILLFNKLGVMVTGIPVFTWGGLWEWLSAILSVQL
jgi:hypothetical protein